MYAFYLIFLPVICLGVPLREWAELDFIIVPFPASGPSGGSCDTGMKQSPIDLTSCAVQRVQPLRLISHGEKRSSGFTLKNTGHSAQIEFLGDKVPVAYGGPLTSNYTLAQLHFHWGTANEGSEHSIDGSFYALEGHFVHFKSSYGTVAEAAVHADGLAVVGIMFELSATDNTDLSEIIGGLSSIHSEGSKTSLSSTTMTWLRGMIDQFDYFTYPGSLTTSPCAESVTWIVLTQKSTISEAQLAEFRSLEGPNGAITENRRSVQLKNDRDVQCDFGCYNSNLRKYKKCSAKTN